MTELIDQPIILLSAMTPPPAPGVYRDVPFAEYRRWDAVNKSSLDDIHEASPMHCRYRRENPQPETPALIMGRAFHTKVLEPEKFDGEFTVAEACCARKRDGASCGNPGKLFDGSRWYCGVHGKEILPVDAGTVLEAEQMASIQAMHDAIFVRNDKASFEARRFIEGEGDNEVSVVWQDWESGLACKARWDMDRVKTWQAIGDLKTTESAADDDLKSSVNKYGYHRQAGFYLMGAKVLGIDAENFVFVFVEKSPPYGVETVVMAADAVEIGRQQIRRCLNIYAHCKQTGIWPGYDGGFRPIGLPEYEVRKHFKKEGAIL